jgi:hypothetical protein
VIDETTYRVPDVPIDDGTRLDKLDQLILEIFTSAGARGLTLEEATDLVCDGVARSDDRELQRLADADPGFRQWRKVKVPGAKELHERPDRCRLGELARRLASLLPR